MLFSLVFAEITILSCFLFFLFIDLHYLITAVIAILTAIQTKAAKAEVETHPVKVEAKITKS